jgi:4-hydroxy-3-methylbut-2-enyl diphosphate reductase
MCATRSCTTNTWSTICAPKGAVFVEELDECPDDRPVIFSAHGVPKSVPAEAAAREMIYVDATCPLVSKVHIEAERHHENGLADDHDRPCRPPRDRRHHGPAARGRGAAGRNGRGRGHARVRDPERLAFVTQTTLSVDDTADIVAALQARFPAIVGPHKEDICYATTNRQEAVKAMAPKADAMLVIGAPNSSNSKRLVEVGARPAAAMRSWCSAPPTSTGARWRASSVGITAGASAPEVLVNEVIDAFRARYDVTVETVETAQENVEFKVPRVLRVSEPA